MILNFTLAFFVTLGVVCALLFGFFLGRLALKWDLSKELKLEPYISEAARCNNGYQLSQQEECRIEIPPEISEVEVPQECSIEIPSEIEIPEVELKPETGGELTQQTEVQVPPEPTVEVPPKPESESLPEANGTPTEPNKVEVSPKPTVDPQPKENNTDTCVLFFPDKSGPCETYYMNFDGEPMNCLKNRCPKMHLKEIHQSSLISILECFRNAKSIDICMYRFTLNCVCRVLTDLKKRRVNIRVITDKSMMENEKSSVFDELRKAGIKVREMYADPGLREEERPLMHNKFAVIDKRLCVAGSFNWTWCALTKHEEFVIKTNQRQVVEALASRFELLWHRYSPANNERALQAYNRRTARQTQPMQQPKVPAKGNHKRP